VRYNHHNRAKPTQHQSDACGNYLFGATQKENQLFLTVKV